MGLRPLLHRVALKVEYHYAGTEYKFYSNVTPSVGEILRLSESKGIKEWYNSPRTEIAGPTGLGTWSEGPW